LHRRALLTTALLGAGAATIPTAAIAARSTAPTPKVSVTQRLFAATDHSAFPSSVYLPNGLLAIVWRQGEAHQGGTNGSIWWSTSDDSGATWAAPSLLFDDPVDDLRDPCIGRSSWGVHVTYFKTAPTGEQLGAWTQLSTDNGQTWGAESRIDSGIQAAMSSPLVELPSSRRLLAFYYDSVPDRFNSVYVARSDDGGATWRGERILADGPAAGRHYNEPVVIRNQKGRLFLFCRWDMRDGIARMVSGDAGRTWTDPVRVLRGVNGRPNVCRLESGVFVLVARRYTGNRASQVFSSDNQGAGWSAPGLLDIPEDLGTYAAPVEVAPGVVCCPFGSQTAKGASVLVVRYLVHDTAATTPHGERVL